jgi:hypothetical protein
VAPCVLGRLPADLGYEPIAESAAAETRQILGDPRARSRVLQPRSKGSLDAVAPLADECNDAFVTD